LKCSKPICNGSSDGKYFMSLGPCTVGVVTGAVAVGTGASEIVDVGRFPAVVQAVRSEMMNPMQATAKTRVRWTEFIRTVSYISHLKYSELRRGRHFIFSI
jgi:hypothetical protein